MIRITVSLGLCAMASLAIGLAGCDADVSRQPSNPTDQVTAGSGERDVHSHSPEEVQKAQEGLAKLSPEDAADAKRQHVCPVSGEMLGTMGAPKKVEVDGKGVWICCDACRDELLADSSLRP